MLSNNDDVLHPLIPYSFIWILNLVTSYYISSMMMSIGFSFSFLTFCIYNFVVLCITGCMECFFFFMESQMFCDTMPKLGFLLVKARPVILSFILSNSKQIYTKYITKPSSTSVFYHKLKQSFFWWRELWF
jgi:hypothetical protein